MEKCRCILHTQLFNEIPTSTNNSFNPRPELFVGTDDDLPVHVSHYLQDLGPEGGQDAMRLFIDLSLKYAPHGRIYNKGLQSGELEGQISCDQWFSMLAFSQSWVILAV
jgi:hypothetical protein